MSDEPLHVRATSEDMHMRVAAALERRGVDSTYEYPGVTAINIGKHCEQTGRYVTEISLLTGMHGWDYATPNVLDVDQNCWQPDEGFDIVPEQRCYVDPALEFSLDPELIARAWADQVDLICRDMHMELLPHPANITGRNKPEPAVSELTIPLDTAGDG